KYSSGTFAHYGCGFCGRNRRPQPIPSTAAGVTSHARPSQRTVAAGVAIAAGLISSKKIEARRPEGLWAFLLVGSRLCYAALTSRENDGGRVGMTAPIVIPVKLGAVRPAKLIHWRE